MALFFRQLNLYHLTKFADVKFNTAKLTVSHFDRAGNIVGKGENAGYQRAYVVVCPSINFFFKHLLL